jgi:hypothetical protein
MSSIIRVLEPRADIRADTEQSHIVLAGSQRVTHTINAADSSQLLPSAPTTSNWSINPPSNQTIMDRKLMVRHYIEVTADAPFETGTNDSLRQFPASSIVDVTTLQINGESVSDQTADKLHAMLCFGNTCHDRSKSVSTSASMPDAYQEYSDWNLYGSGKDPLKEYGENSCEDGRGGFPTFDVVSPTVRRYVVTEPVWVSPLFSGIGHQVEGMVNVNQLNLSLRYKTDTSLSWSHASTGQAITSVSTKFYRAPELLVTYLTPDSLQPIPDVQVLPYMKPQTYIKNAGTVVPGDTTQLFSDSIRLSQIPRLVYLFVRHDQASSGFATPDSFLAIDGVSVNWNNESGLLASATKQDLFEISSRNGLNVSYPGFSKYRGSVLCLEMGKDIGLPDSQAPGVQGSYTLQVNLTVKNTGASNFSGDFYMVTMNEGTFSVAQNSARASIGNLSPEMVLAATAAPHISDFHYRTVHGGSFWSGLKNVLGSVASGIQKVAPIASAIMPELAPIISQVSDVAGASGRLLGKGRAVGGSRLVGGGLKRR